MKPTNQRHDIAGDDRKKRQKNIHFANSSRHRNCVATSVDCHDVSSLHITLFLCGVLTNTVLPLASHHHTIRCVSTSVIGSSLTSFASVTDFICFRVCNTTKQRSEAANDSKRIGWTADGTRRAESDERRTTDDERRTTNEERRTKNDERRTTNNDGGHRRLRRCDFCHQLSPTHQHTLSRHRRPATTSLTRLEQRGVAQLP